MIRITRFQNVGFSTPKKIEKKVIWCPPFERQKSDISLGEVHPEWITVWSIKRFCGKRKHSSIIINKYSAAHFRGLVQHDYALEKLWFMMILLIDNHFLLVEPFWHVLTCFATAHKQIIDFWNYCSPAEILKWIGSFKFWLFLFLTFSLEVRKKSVGYLQPQKLSRPLRTTFVTDCQKKPLKLLPSLKSNFSNILKNQLVF